MRQKKEVYDNCKAIVKLALEYGADASKQELCGNTETYTLLLDYRTSHPETPQYIPVNPRRII